MQDSTSFRGLTDADLRELHTAIVGRDVGLRSRSALTSSLLRRRQVAQTTHVFASTSKPSANTGSNVFRGLRVSATPRRRFHEAAAPTDTIPTVPPRKKNVAIALASTPALLQLMKVKTGENESLKEQLREFVESPQNAMRMWAECCEEMRKRLTTFKYLRLLCVGLSTSPRRSTNDGDDQNYVDYSEMVDAKRAEWTLCRRFERGPSHLIDVWKGLSRPDLVATCDGFYFVHNAATLRSTYERNVRKSRLRDKVRLIRESIAAKRRIVDEEADADETEEIFAGLDDSDEADVPSLHIALDISTGVMELSMCLSPSQFAAAMNQRSNPDGLTSGSNMLFGARAGCVGVDTWLVFTDGPWKHKLLEFVRKPATGNGHTRLEATDVEAVVVDQVAFAKRYAAPCTKMDDPFVCTRCGAERRHNNYVYATKFGDLRRGQYQCAVCEKATVHVSKGEADQQSRPRWQSTKTVQQEPVLGLSQFGFDR